jgi:mannose-1-phosphate guanylyltransferase/phosphomannomutase
VSCPSALKGAVMREIALSVAGLEVEMTEGIRVERDGGWALVLPDPAEPLVHVFAEGPDAITAHGLLVEYTGLVEGVASPEAG